MEVRSKRKAERDNIGRKRCAKEDRNFHQDGDEVLVKIRRGGRRVLVGT